jgi:hypothetical protein
MNHQNLDEPEEDRALRAELRGMLGIEAPPPVRADAEQSAALAQSLHREAQRRRRTSADGAKASVRPLRGRPMLVALAAVIPWAVTFAALGAWGIGQKHRADALAAKTAELESRQSRMEEAIEAAKAKEAKEAPTLRVSEHSPAPPRSGELVKPEERPTRRDNAGELHRVRDGR